MEATRVLLFPKVNGFFEIIRHLYAYDFLSRDAAAATSVVDQPVRLGHAAVSGTCGQLDVSRSGTSDGGGGASVGAGSAFLQTGRTKSSDAGGAGGGSIRDGNTRTRRG